MGMRAQDGSLKDACLEKLQLGEPFFVLRGRDLLASWTVRQWAHNAQQNGTPQSKVDEALACASAMEEWAHRNGGKVPD